MPKSYALNLTTLILAGVLVSGWFLFYTDWFEVVGGLLALSGILSWLAFVSKILPDERTKQLQAVFDARVLGKPWTWMVVSGLLAIFIVIVFCFGSLELKTRNRPGEYLVDVRSSDDLTREAPDDFVAVTPGASTRTLRPFWRTHVVHVKGYPTIHVRLWPLWRTTVVVPDSFAAPVVLLRPTPDLINAARGKNNNKTLFVAVNDAQGNTLSSYTMNFDGTAVWVGCDDDVELPPTIYEAWQRQWTSQENAAYFSKWSRPRSLFRECQERKSGIRTVSPLRLAPGQKLVMTLFKDPEKKEPYSKQPIEVPVEMRNRWEDFPKVVDLDWKEPT